MARPTQALTVTRLPRLWSTAKRAMGRFCGALRRRGVGGVLAYHLEPNPGDDDWAHCHAWFRGEHLSHALLTESAIASGLGCVAFEAAAFVAAESYARPTMDYGLKMVLADRPAEPTELWPAAAAFLNLNGGSLVHATRGFWQDWLGRPLLQRAARTVAHRGGRSGGSGPGANPGSLPRAA